MLQVQFSELSIHRYSCPPTRKASTKETFWGKRQIAVQIVFFAFFIFNEKPQVCSSTSILTDQVFRGLVSELEVNALDQSVAQVAGLNPSSDRD